MKYYISTIILLFSFSSYAQLTLEKDINIEPASSEPGIDGMVELDGIIYFAADDGTHNVELFTYDPATGQASLTNDLRTKEGTNGMTELIVYNGKIYFATRADGSTIYLYAYDPSTKETEMIRDADNQRIRKPSNFYVYNDLLFYRTEISNSTDAVHTYNASTGTTRSLGMVQPDGRSVAGNFNAVDDRLYFSAFSGTESSNIYYYDMTTDTIHQYEYTSPSGIYGGANQLTYFQGWLFYSDASDLVRGTTTAINLSTSEVKNFSIFEFTPSGERPNEFFPFAGKLYFSAFSNSPKRALFEFDPTTEEVTKVLQIMTDASSAPGSFMELDGKMYFTVQASTDDDPQTYIYSYDPVSDVFTDEATFANENSPGYITISLAYEGKLYCSGYRDDVASELFSYDPETDDLALLTDINPNTASANPSAFTEYKGQLYFTASSFQVGSGIWKYDPSTGETNPVVTDIFSPRAMIVVGDKLFVDGSLTGIGYGLNYYDSESGQITGTTWRSPDCINCINEMVLYDDKIYMSVQINNEIGSELYTYDPITDTGELIADINPDGNSRPNRLIILNGDLYFNATTNEGELLHKYNSNTKILESIKDVDSQITASSVRYLIKYNGKLYFSAKSETQRDELFSYDPNLQKLTQITSYDSGMRPTHLVINDNKIFFSGIPSSSIGRELHSFDPMTEEVTLELDLIAGGGNSALSWRFLTEFNGNLYFSNDTDEYGSEFWEYSDGEAKIIADIRLGSLGSDPSLFTQFNEKLYFTADDGATGVELWSYASCINATVETEPESESALGSIDVSVVGGTAPYTYLWSDGETSEDRPEASAGVYTLTIYDSSGCIANITVEITFLTATTDVNSNQSLSVYPNPTSGHASIDLPTTQNGMIYIRSIEGRLVFAKKLKSGQTHCDLDLSRMESGMYMVQLVSDKKQMSSIIYLAE